MTTLLSALIAFVAIHQAKPIEDPSVANSPAPKPDQTFRMEESVRRVAWSRDSTRFAACGMTKGAIVVGKLREDQFDGRRIRCSTEDVTLAVAYSADGSILVSSDATNHVRFWNADNLEELDHADFPTQARSISFSPDGKWLAAGFGDRKVRLFDAKSHKELKTISGFVSTVERITFAADGKSFITGGMNPVQSWSPVDGKMIRDFGAHAEDSDPKNTVREIYSISFSPDGKKFATDGGDGRIRIWDASSGRALNQIRFKCMGPNGSGWLADGKTLICGGASLAVFALEAASGKVVVAYGSTNYCTPLAVSPDGKWILFGYGIGGIHLYRQETFLNLAK